MGGDVDNAQVGESSLVKRATIRNSILGRSVWVNEGALIEDSIVMDHTSVGKGAHLRRAIVDRFNIIPADAEIGLRPRRRPPSLPRRRLGAGGGAARRAPRVLPGPRRVLNRVIVIHGHFYQPPRENPGSNRSRCRTRRPRTTTGTTRVTAECYAPNTAARRVDEANKVLDIVNNFEKISFNVGPTLFAWLARERPDVYAKILEADRASVAARDGHGNAIAQVYNHMIMPLASRRDKVTQVRWGLDDFARASAASPKGSGCPRRRWTTSRSRCSRRPG